MTLSNAICRFGVFYIATAFVVALSGCAKVDEAGLERWCKTKVHGIPKVPRDYIFEECLANPDNRAKFRLWPWETS